MNEYRNAHKVAGKASDLILQYTPQTDEELGDKIGERLDDIQTMMQAVLLTGSIDPSKFAEDLEAAFYVVYLMGKEDGLGEADSAHDWRDDHYD